MKYIYVLLMVLWGGSMWFSVAESSDTGQPNQESLREVLIADRSVLFLPYNIPPNKESQGPLIEAVIEFLDNNPVLPNEEEKDFIQEVLIIPTDLDQTGLEIPVSPEVFPSSGPDVKHAFSNQMSINMSRTEAFYFSATKKPALGSNWGLSTLGVVVMSGEEPIQSILELLQDNANNNPNLRIQSVAWHGGGGGWGAWRYKEQLPDYPLDIEQKYKH